MATFPSIAASAIIGTKSVALVLGFHVGEVAPFAFPMIFTLTGAIYDRWCRPCSSGRITIWNVSGLMSLLFCICACEELSSRIYAQRPPSLNRYRSNKGLVYLMIMIKLPVALLAKRRISLHGET